jgi:site-specific DNA recombinase
MTQPASQIRAAIYARVSSAAQRDAQTIESQLHVLKPYVEKQGWILVGIYVDDGRSAKTGKLSKRDGFAQLIRAAARKEIDVVVTTAMDRLTRTEDLIELAAILGPFQRAGISIYSPSRGELDLNTQHGAMIAIFEAQAAAIENVRRAERIKAGKLRAIAENRKPAGPTPFGLRYERATGKWSVDDEAAAIVNEIYTRVAGGETCVRIADDLARRGVRGPKKGWTKAAVYRCMHTRYACGEWCVDKKRDVTIAVPRIVTDELWFAAQRALMKAQRRGLNRTTHVYLLQSIAVCACGSPIVIRSGVKYFNAAHEAREHPAAYVCKARKEQKTCKEPIAYCRELDDRVWAALAAELEQPELVAALSVIEHRRAGDARDWAKDAEGYRAHLTRLDKHEAYCYSEMRRGRMSQAAWEIERPALERERKMVQDQLRTAMQALGSISSAQERLREATLTVERLRSALPLATPEQRRALLRKLVREGGVRIEGGRAYLDLRLLRQEEAASLDAYAGGTTLRVVDQDF